MIALITPTGARQKQIELCAQWMRNQMYEGDVLWVIVDDALPRTTNKIDSAKEYILHEKEGNFIDISTLSNTFLFKPNWTVIKIYPETPWKPGMNTQSRNINVAIHFLIHLKNVKINSIFIIEDDDYYSKDYLSVMVEKLKNYDVVAETNTIYFHTKEYTYKEMQNKQHGSLFETAFNFNVLPLFMKAVATNDRFIDCIFWREALKAHKCLLFDSPKRLAVGMKGQPGREGIGMGHKMEGVASKNAGEKLMRLMNLKKLIGIDYLSYL